MTESSAQVSGPRQPSGVISRNTRPGDNNDMDPREALELQQIQTQEDNELNYSTPSASSGDEYRVVTRRTTSRADAQRRQQARKGRWGKLTQLWTHNVTLTVPHKSSRDYFGAYRAITIMTDLSVLGNSNSAPQLWRGHSLRISAPPSSFRSKVCLSRSCSVCRRRRHWRTGLGFVGSVHPSRSHVIVWLFLLLWLGRIDSGGSRMLLLGVTSLLEGGN